jgi:hypothetical protein
MRESSTIQAFIEEGRVKELFEEARKIILRLGGIRFGEAGDAVVSRLDAISNLEKLEQLVERLLIVSSWDQLLGQEGRWSRGIPDMEESSTIRAFIEEGRRKGREEWLSEEEAGEARRIILRLGRIHFGKADDAVVSRLEAISDLEQLEQLVERLFIVSSWDELLSGE